MVFLKGQGSSRHPQYSTDNHIRTGVRALAYTFVSLLFLEPGTELNSLVTGSLESHPASSPREISGSFYIKPNSCKPMKTTAMINKV